MKWSLEESRKAFHEVGAHIDIGRVHMAGARIALRQPDEQAQHSAEAARKIFAERGAKTLEQETADLLAKLNELRGTLSSQRRISRCRRTP